ncbi:MAG TPA: hypothetical protein VD999_07740 [Vitreimonas sp.]|nr:hypothetical protein [Vitreimonas sp.]
MAKNKAQAAQAAEPVITEKLVKNVLNIKTLLASAGIEITDEQAEALSSKIVVKKVGRAKATYKKGEVVLKPEDKAANQVRVALDVLEDGMTIDQWAEACSLDTRFVTKQDPAKVLMYYQKQLIDQGLLVKA